RPPFGPPGARWYTVAWVATVEGQASGTGQALLYVGLVAAVAAVGGVLFGYDTGVISGAILYVPRDFALGPTAVGVVRGIVALGALVGAMGAGGMADGLGRRMTNISAGVLFVLASLASAAATGVGTLVVGRFLVGCGIGLTSVAAPMYIAEVAPAGVRGR